MSEQVPAGSGPTPVFPYRTPAHFDSQHHPAWVKTASNRLSPREREILALLAARWTDREIAEALYISYRTVTTHVSNIYDKLGIHSRREAAAFASVLPNPITIPPWPASASRDLTS
ncbi:MAG: helix-turn-helix transcriptional regulator [Chloroflexota bacterium]|nr:helix-turn-helix transcriptional regulator [Chloroflexota bacterium]